jgi:hypothetical protein
MVAWITLLLSNADATGVPWPGFTSGTLMIIGLCLAGLGMWGRRRSRQGTWIDGRYLALGVREVNCLGASLVYEKDERRGAMNEDVLKGKWK